MYHRFVDAPSREVDGHPVEVLDGQMAAIRAHHEPWTVQRHFEALTGAPGDGDCPVVVTVDDGYRDFATVALPLFEEHRIPVTLYVTTGFVAGEHSSFSGVTLTGPADFVFDGVIELG